MMKQFVYFVRPTGQEGPVKIGCSEEPVERLSTLMTWSPVKLEIVATVPGDLKLERRIHGLFAGSHSHREWFHASKALAEFIAKLAAGTPIDQLVDFSAPLQRFRDGHRKHSYSPDRRRYLSYMYRFLHAGKRQHAAGDKRTCEPLDVCEIMYRWQGWGKYARGGAVEPVTPTDAEIARLDEVLRNPAQHFITREERWPPKDKKAA